MAPTTHDASRTAGDGWQFTDDRGHLITAARRPAAVIAYLQAGAALHDLGIPCAGVFGSAHDDATAPDPAKAGTLPLHGTPYFGAGPALDPDAVLAAAPDLLVTVTYGGGQVYGLTPEAAKHLEEQVPLAVLDVGGSRDLSTIRSRFAALATALGARPNPDADSRLSSAQARLSDVAASHPALRVAALSPADQETVHLARPHAWPDLAALTALGVGLVEPEPGPGTNWSTTDRPRATALRPDLILADTRAHATPLPDHFGPGTRTAPWNPELPPSARAHAAFFEGVADALEGAAARTPG